MMFRHLSPTPFQKIFISFNFKLIMNLKLKNLILLLFLILAFFLINYNFLDSKLKGFFPTGNSIFVTSVVDGDTVKFQKNSIRLLGINCPETGEEFSSEAKNYLIQKIFNKTVLLEFGKDKKDKYNRTLAYIFFENENLNSEIIRQGFANPYFPSGKDKFTEQFFNAWEECILNQKNLCEPSTNKCSNCISLKELNFKTQKVVLENICSFSCDLTLWKIKEEGRKEFYFPSFVLFPSSQVSIIAGKGKNSSTTIFWDEGVVWTETGDTFFLRDNKNRLVFWETFNY